MSPETRLKAVKALEHMITSEETQTTDLILGLSKETWTRIIMSALALIGGAIGTNLDRIWWPAEKGDLLEVKVRTLEEAIKKIEPCKCNTDNPKVIYN